MEEVLYWIDGTGGSEGIGKLAYTPQEKEFHFSTVHVSAPYLRLTERDREGDIYTISVVGVNPNLSGWGSGAVFEYSSIHRILTPPSGMSWPFFPVVSRVMRKGTKYIEMGDEILCAYPPPNHSTKDSGHIRAAILASSMFFWRAIQDRAVPSVYWLPVGVVGDLPQEAEVVSASERTAFYKENLVAPMECLKFMWRRENERYGAQSRDKQWRLFRLFKHTFA
jgi:hypothetical protein